MHSDRHVFRGEDKADNEGAVRGQHGLIPRNQRFEFGEFREQGFQQVQEFFLVRHRQVFEQWRVKIVVVFPGFNRSSYQANIPDFSLCWRGKTARGDGDGSGFAGGFRLDPGRGRWVVFLPEGCAL